MKSQKSTTERKELKNNVSITSKLTEYVLIIFPLGFNLCYALSLTNSMFYIWTVILS